MSFLYPNFLWTLFLVAIPIIVHLFSFRIHKTIYFSNVKYLKNIEKQNKSKSRLKQILVLISRILLLISLILAFSFPYIDKNSDLKNVKEKIVSIYIDNSFSMNAESVYGNTFDAAKERAKSIINSYNNNQKFVFFNNQFETKYKNITNKAQILKFVNETDLSAKRKKLSQIIEEQTQFLDIELKNTSYLNNLFIISDFQKNISDFEGIKTDSNQVIKLIPLASNKINNIYIDSIWFESLERRFNKIETLNVKIVNFGDEDYKDIPIKLLINNKQKAISNFNINKKSEKNIKINFTNTEKGILKCMLEINDYPISFDNSFYFNYKIINKINILLIGSNKENKYIKALFTNKDDFSLDYSNIDNLKSSEIYKYQLIILNELENFSSGFIQIINDFVANGGNLFFIPNTNGNLQDYNKLLSNIDSEKFIGLDTTNTQIETIEYQHFIYKDVFDKQNKKIVLPYLKNHFKKENKLLNNEKILLKSVNNITLLRHINLKKSNVYILSFSINKNNSNFVLHPLFVPTFYNIAAFSTQNNKLYHTIGKEKNINLIEKVETNEQILHIKSLDNTFNFIPNTTNTNNNLKLSKLEAIKKAENYILTNNSDTICGLSFNYDRKESEIDFYTENEIKDLIDANKLKNTEILSANIDNLSSEMNEIKNARKDLWKIFIVLALTFLIIEILLVKLWKN